MAELLPRHAAVQGGWLPPATRATLLSLRPWSFTLSVLPVVAAACAASWFDEAAASLARVALVCVGVVCLHAAANLVNTIRDFDKGVDQRESADDRTLVDRLVPRGTLVGLALGSAVAGLAVLGAFVAAGAGLSPHPVFDVSFGHEQAGAAAWEVTGAIVGIGFALAVLYSAGPCGLKYNAAGEVAVLFAFGPLLGAGASQALTGSVLPSCVLSAAPFGLFAVAVLHANNVRDIEPDRAAGARTLAQSLPRSANRFLFNLALSGGFVAAAGAVLEASTPKGHGGLEALRAAWAASPGRALPPLPPLRAAPGLLLLAACVPWALALSRRFRARRLATLPQQTAQLASLAGGALLAGLVAPPTAARGLLAVLFGLGGINNVVMWGHSAALVTAKLRNATGLALPAWLCRVVAVGSFAGQTVASVTLTLGWWSCGSAWVLLLFLVAVTPTVHDMWSYSGEDSEGATSAAAAASAAAMTAAGAGGASPQASEADEGASGQEVDEESDVAPAVAGRSSSAMRRRRPSRRPTDHETASEAPATAAADQAFPDPLARALEAGGGGVPTFLDPFSSEFVHFFKNVGMAGGLLALLAADPACGLG